MTNLERGLTITPGERMKGCHGSAWKLIVVLAVAATVACDRGESAARAGAQDAAAGDAACDAPAVRDVVTQLGERLQHVSLLAPDTLVIAQISERYGPLVTPELLAAWTRDPAHAPGRQTSSPWPARIEIRSVNAAGDGGCVVRGDVVYVTSAAAGAPATREPLVVRLRDDGAWRIAAYEPAGASAHASSAGADDGAAGAASPEAAVRVLRSYYAAIGERDFAAAHALWSDGGAASGQTLDEFAAGFAETATVRVEVGEAEPVEGAAGSVYVRVPVVVHAVTTSGQEQRFHGTYTLRRSTVDGASPEQRAWRIHSAALGGAR